MSNGDSEKDTREGGDYVLGVKENQRILYEEMRGYFEYLDSPEVQEHPEDQRESDPEKRPWTY
jgi:hypothetical protein